MRIADVLVVRIDVQLCLFLHSCFRFGSLRPPGQFTGEVKNALRVARSRGLGCQSERGYFHHDSRISLLHAYVQEFSKRVWCESSEAYPFSCQWGAGHARRHGRWGCRRMRSWVALATWAAWAA